MNLTWKLTGTERLILYYDSVEKLGQLACFKCLFFASNRSDLREETRKAMNRLKGLGSR